MSDARCQERIIMGWGFNEKVREQIKVLGVSGREVANSELAVALGLVSHKDKRGMYRALADMRKHGEVKRRRPGIYIYTAKPKTEDEICQRIWRVIRSNRVVTIDDLIELTGASRAYAKEYVQMLAGREIVRRIPGKHRSEPIKYQLINDPVIMPKNEDNAKKLRKLRKQKKAEALKALAAADIAIRKAQKKILEIHD